MTAHIDSNVYCKNASNSVELVSGTTIPSEGMICRKCGKTFYEISYGSKTRCKECRRDYNHKHYQDNKEEIKMKYKEYNNQWRKNNRDKVSSYSKGYRKRKISKMSPEQAENFLKYQRTKMKESRQRIKDDVYRAYGGYKCACCGETEP